jgi:integrase
MGTCKEAVMKKEQNLKFIQGRDGKPGYYVTEITLGYRRIRRFAGYTKEEAKTYLGELRIAYREGRLEELLRPERTKGDIFGVYGRMLLDSAEWKAKRSASRNEISFKNLKRVFEDTRLADISPGMVRRYVTKRKEEGMSAASINRELSLLKSILYAAEYDGLIASNPIRGRRVKKLDENNSREKLILNLNLTDDDLRRLVDSAAPHLKPILELALITGMRRGEILKMKWKDVDIRLGTIRVPEENSKTKRERFIPIDANLAAELDSIEKKGDHVFFNPETGKNIVEIKRAFKTALKAAGIEGLHFHDLRHLAAYRLVKVTDVVTASKILGHASIQMTMRYVHPTDADKRAAVEKAAENLFRGRQKDVNAEIEGSLEGLEKQAQIH